MRRFAYCQCFLSQNIFLPNLGLHVKFENDQQFKNDYKNAIDHLEDAIELAKAEVNRRLMLRSNVLKRMEQTMSLYEPRNPGVFKFDAGKMLSDQKNDVTKVGPEVYSMPVLKSTFAKELLEELKHFKALNIPHEQPNSMNRHGILLDEIGFKDLFDSIRSEFIQPLARQLYADQDLVLDSHKAFIVVYNKDQAELAPHFDNAEITMNIALSEDDSYSGGELVFNDLSNPSSRFGYEHHLGHGVLHRHSGLFCPSEHETSFFYSLLGLPNIFFFFFLCMKFF